MKNLTIVMYHYVRNIQNSRYPEIKGLEYTVFKQQIEFFNQKYNVITMEEVIAAWNESYELPENAMLLTFDDGYIDHYTFAMPVLKTFGMQGSFFIPGKTFKESVLLDVNKIHFILASQPSGIIMTDLLKQLDYYRGEEFEIPSNEMLIQNYAVANRFDTKETIFVKRVLQTAIPEGLRNIISSNLFSDYVTGLTESQFAKELYMNYDQIKCMKQNGMFIGIHGYDHYWLGNLEEEAMKKDVDKALEALDGVVDRKSWVMNYPYGSYNDNVVQYLGRNGCKLAMTTEVRTACVGKDMRYRLPRYDTNDFPPVSKNYKGGQS